MGVMLAAGFVAVVAAITLAALAVVPGSPDSTADFVAKLRRTAAPAEYLVPASPRGESGESPSRLVSIGRRATSRREMSLLERQIDATGAAWTLEQVLAFRALAAFGCAAAGLASMALWVRDGRAASLAVAVLAGATYFLPNLVLHHRGHQRKERIRRDLPDIMDLLTITVEAGLAFDAALSQVAARASGPLAEELRRANQELRVGNGRTAVFKALAARTGVPEVRAFAAAVIQATRDGLPLGKVLRAQADEVRVKRLQAAEESAQKIGVKITVPLVFFILPSLLIVLLGPAAITAIDSGLVGQ